ncbi:helix-turn-helix transcriptional regulator [Sphingomonas sp. CROZ-RG-20F-R02-07]|uniref:helix-turn-helix transcriptional regulator n=1 Tax=Sphingomonas sp. CROZ-RG-20F-R02-07 TaxID=2914832 RepID=UPI001F56E0BC|nr:helix-turn-helix transcriptional regulator [Sphingomonas sp. CROZ-RG-20F-R02-07]
MAKLILEQRKALGTFLASIRARVQPGDVGLIDGPRRTPGLRREEVAALAGVSVSWYTWIEQGRDIQISTDTVGRLANVLRLDQVESAHLFALATNTRPASNDSVNLSDSLRTLIDTIDPVAAYVRNAYFDILAWNRSITQLFIDYGKLQPHERNTIRLMFLYPPYRDLIVDWESLAQGYVSSLRAARARAFVKAPFDRLAAELCEASPEFKVWWSEVDVTSFDEGYKRLRHPLLGEVEYTYVTMTPEKQPGLSVVTYLLRQSAGDSGS